VLFASTAIKSANMAAIARGGVLEGLWSSHPYGYVLSVLAFATDGAVVSRIKRIGLGFVFLWFLVGGIAHFVATKLEMRIVPPYIPWPRTVVLVTGVLELLGAFGVLMPASRRWAGIGLFLLTIAVTPANVYMLQSSAGFAVPFWLLVVRLPAQVALLALIAWSTGMRQTR
jgi:uncharacterized membrane protein